MVGIDETLTQRHAVDKMHASVCRHVSETGRTTNMRTVLKTAAGLALAFALGAPAIAQDTLTIGIMVPTTGSEATYGQDMANAVNLAIGEINAAGGVLGKQLTS